MNQTSAPPAGSYIPPQPPNNFPPPSEENQPKPKRLTKYLAVLAGLFVIAGAFFAVTHRSNKPASQPQTAAVKKTVSKTMDQSIRLIAAGDFIAHDSLNQQAKQADGSYNYLQFMSDFKPVFAAADIRFCNQATISGGEQFGISGYPVFNAPTQFAKDMAGLGCNLVNTASNHSFDKGQAAIDSTVGVWGSLSGLLAVAGENRSQPEQNTVKYFNIKGVKFAFLAYTTYSNSTPSNSYGVNMYSEAFAKSQIEQAKLHGAKFIIASMRWGTEYSSQVNAEQARESQFLADQGVDLILGHGPHQLQTVKRLSGTGGHQTLVWYSLGNFVNTQEPAETLFNGLAVIDIDRSSVKISNASYLPIYMHYEWNAAQKAADNLPSRHNLHLYLLDDATQDLIDKNQLQTTVAAQRQRIDGLLNANLSVPIISRSQYYQ